MPPCIPPSRVLLLVRGSDSPLFLSYRTTVTALWALRSPTCLPRTGSRSGSWAMSSSSSITPSSTWQTTASASPHRCRGAEPQNPASLLAKHTSAAIPERCGAPMDLDVPLCARTAPCPSGISVFPQSPVTNKPQHPQSSPASVLLEAQNESPEPDSCQGFTLQVSSTTRQAAVHQSITGVGLRHQP